MLLTAQHNGAVINVSLRGFDEITGSIHFYASVCVDVEYRFAEPVPDYVAAFSAAMENHRDPAVFTGNCILNYLHAELEEKRAGSITGPITNGEIAHRLPNQTPVRLLVGDVSPAVQRRTAAFTRPGPPALQARQGFRQQSSP